MFFCFELSSSTERGPRLSALGCRGLQTRVQPSLLGLDQAAVGYVGPLERFGGSGRGVFEVM